MLFSILTFVMCLFAAANAHFQLLYPLPRGNFAADNEPNFCGGYADATTNRTTFPLSEGFFSIKSGHPSFTGYWSDPFDCYHSNNFDNFSVNGVQQIASPYTKETSPGTYCIPLNISATGFDGVKDGSNVTLQIVFAGGDGNLYQCADLTLKANFNIPSSVTCTNETVTATATTSNPSSSSGSLCLSQKASVAAALLFIIFGVIVVLL